MFILIPHLFCICFSTISEVRKKQVLSSQQMCIADGTASSIFPDGAQKPKDANFRGSQRQTEDEDRSATCAELVA